MSFVSGVAVESATCYKCSGKADLHSLAFSLAQPFGTASGDRAEMYRRELVWLVWIASSLLVSRPHGQGVGAEERTASGSPAPGLRALAVAMGPFRPFEARLSGGFRYAPFRPASGPCKLDFETFQKSRFQARLAAEVRIREDAEENPTAASLGALGTLLLIQGRLEEAVETLQRAARMDPNDERVRSDLTVAYYQSGLAGTDPLGLVKAADLVEAAAESGPLLPEMAFNRVVFLDKWFLKAESRALWKTFCADPSNRDWCEPGPGSALTDEGGPAVAETGLDAKTLLTGAAMRQAGERLKGLVRRFPQAARELGEQDLLSQWADAYLGEDDSAPSLLEAAKAVGEALQGVNGERLLADSVAAIVSSDPKARKRLARGQRSLARGLRLLAQADVPPARESFTEALRLLEKSPMRHWAGFQLAICLYYLSDFDQSRSRLRALLEADPHYRSLRARVDWMLGLIEIDTGDRTASLAFYLQALEIFESLNEASNRVAVHNLLANSYRFMGAVEPAWRHQRQALAGLDECSPSRRYQILIETAVALLQEGCVHLALRFQNQAVEVAKAIGEASRLAEARWWRARIEWKLGATDQAQADLAAAIQTTEAIPPGVRERARADILMTQGEMLSRSDPSRAIESIGEALEYYSTRGYQVYVSRLYLARSRAHRKLGRVEDAHQDLLRAVEQAERQREPARGTAYDLDELDQLRPVYDEAVEFEHHVRKDDVAAFEYSERGHARRLAELQGANAVPGLEAAPASLAAMAGKLPPATAIVYFHVLRASLLIGVLSGRGLDAVESGLGEAALNAAVEAVPDDMGAGRNSRTLSALFDHLLRPVWDHLEGIDTLVIVPDKALNSVPFAALVDSRTGSYLVESKTLIFAPSATTYYQALERDRDTAPSEARFLLVGSEAGGREEELPELLGVREEINQIAKIHRHARVSILLGDSATKAAFLKQAGHATHLHFAGHALGNARHPEFSRLLLAPSPNRAGALYASEISSRDFGSLRLVVLAACQTGAGPIHRGEGILGLTRSFLAVGAPAVASNLWAVDDVTAASFFPRYHRFLEDGQDPFSALRSAQLEFIQATSPIEARPRNWAGFQVWGGGDRRR